MCVFNGKYYFFFYDYFNRSDVPIFCAIIKNINI